MTTEELKLLPCPNCGHTPDWTDWQSAPDGRSIQRYCRRCDMTGPSAKTLENAAVAWNALPRHLQWTKEPPQNADYDIWLWREYPGNMPQPYTIYWAVQAVKGKVEKILVAQADLEDDRVRRVSSMGGEWAGPIPEPEE